MFNSPKASTALAAAASISALLATFATTVIISALYSFLSLSAVFSTLGDKSTIQILAPCLTYASEIPSPKPAAAPVINATFPSNLPILYFLLQQIIMIFNILLVHLAFE